MVLIFSEEKLSAIGSLVVEKHKGQTQGIRKVKWFILLVILCMAIEQVSAPKRPHYSLRKGTLKKSRESAKRAKIDQYDDESDTEDPIDDNGF